MVFSTDLTMLSLLKVKKSFTPVALGQKCHGSLLGQRGLDPVLDPDGDLAEVVLGGGGSSRRCKAARR